MTYREYNDYDEVLEITQDEIQEAFCLADMVINEAKRYLQSL
jgi:hypothetical protein